MSAAAATPPAADAAAAPAAGKGSKKKLIVIGAALAVLLAGGGGGAVFMMKKRAAAAAAAAAAEDDGEAAQEAAPTPKADLKHAPTFVPLDPFTVNLADRDAERYAQVGITLELADAKAGDLLKAYMPAIRNNILLALASKQAGELMDHEGKVQLAGEIRAAAVKPLGYTVDAKAASVRHGNAEDDAPIRAVHFSNFIIQ
jgi:flagellar protein FliL